MVESVSQETVDKINAFLPEVINMLEFGKEYKRSDLNLFGYPDWWIDQSVASHYFVIRKGFANEFFRLHSELKKYVNFK